MLNLNPSGCFALYGFGNDAVSFISNLSESVGTAVGVVVAEYVGDGTTTVLVRVAVSAGVRV